MQHDSATLTARQRSGLEKLGDVYSPGDSEFPSFSQLGCASHADEILAELPPGDRRALQQLLGACRYLPSWLLTLFIRLAESGTRVPGPIGNNLRLLRLGLRGFVFTLYYSGRIGANYDGRSPLQIIDYDVSVYTDDLSAEVPDQ